MTVSFTLNGTLVSATIEDTNAGRSFLAMLPLTLTLSDYAGTEKIADLPQAIDIADAPAGYEPKAGDLAYYAPWGNLAIFQKDFRYSTGLVKLGRIETGFDALLQPGEAQVTIEQGN